MTYDRSIGADLETNKRFGQNGGDIACRWQRQDLPTLRRIMIVSAELIKDISASICAMVHGPA